MKIRVVGTDLELSHLKGILQAVRAREQSQRRRFYRMTNVKAGTLGKAKAMPNFVLGQHKAKCEDESFGRNEL